MALEEESNKEKLKQIIKQEIVPKLLNLGVPLPEECVEYLILNSKLTQVSKDQYLQEPGSYQDGQLIFLYSGIALSSYYDLKSHRIFATRLWKEDEIIVDANSFVNHEDRRDSIQMLEDGELISLDYNKLKDLLDKFPKLIAPFACSVIYPEKYHRFYGHLLISTFKERVKLFLERYPNLVDRISKDAIALYLNMPRSSFNRAYAQFKHNKGGEGI